MTIDEDTLSHRLDELAAWGRPDAVPPLPGAAAVHAFAEARSGRPLATRLLWIATAAALVAGLLMTTRRSDPLPAIADGTWTTIAKAPIPGLAGAASVWTGEELVVVGGEDPDGTRRLDAAAYDPVANRWRRLDSTPIALGSDVRAFAVRDEVWVFPEWRPPSRKSDAIANGTSPPPSLALSLSTGAWRVLASSRDLVAPVVSDGQAFAIDPQVESSIMRLDEATATWIKSVDLPREARDGRQGWQSIASANGAAFFLPGAVRDHDVFIDPFDGSVRRVPSVGLTTTPFRQGWASEHYYELGGRGILLLGVERSDDGGDPSTSAHILEVGSQRWKQLPGPPFEENTGWQVASAGRWAFVIGGIEGTVRADAQGSVATVLDAPRRRWYELPSGNVDLRRAGHVAVWTGGELIVWGGRTTPKTIDYDTQVFSHTLSDGAVYRPRQ